MAGKQEQRGTVFSIQRYSVNDGPGIRTSVFLKGCPLRCGWCSNPESQEAAPQRMGKDVKGKVMSVDEVMDVVLRDRPFYEESGGGVTLSGGEVLAQPAFARALLAAAQEEGLHTCCETTGFAAAEVAEEVLGHADLVLFDVKHWDSARHRQGTGVPNERILGNLQNLMGKGGEVLVRIPVIPGFNDGAQDAAAFARLLLGMGMARCQLLPFHQFGEGKYQMLGREYAYEGHAGLHREDLEEYRAIMGSLGVDAFC